MYVYIYIHVYVYIYYMYILCIYIYIYIERERESEGGREGGGGRSLIFCSCHVKVLLGVGSHSGVELAINEGRLPSKWIRFRVLRGLRTLIALEGSRLSSFL